MINLVKTRYWFFAISGSIILAGIILLATVGLKPGIDFTAGTSATFRIPASVNEATFRAALSDLGYSRATIQSTGQNDYFVRLPELGTAEKTALISGLNSKLGSVTALDYYTVSPSLASDTVRDVGIALAVASVGILLYIAWAFRKVRNSFQWGTAALVPLLHDVFIVVTVFSVLGWAMGMEIDALFISGVLAIIGYSINNTIVVFDRIRDNLGHLGKQADFATTVNSSIVQTIARSVNTSMTALIVVFCLFLFGGSTIHNFMLVLMVGIIAGTYSASCIAPQILVEWNMRSNRRLSVNQSVQAKKV